MLEDHPLAFYTLAGAVIGLVLSVGVFIGAMRGLADRPLQRAMRKTGGIVWGPPLDPSSPLHKAMTAKPRDDLPSVWNSALVQEDDPPNASVESHFGMLLGLPNCGCEHCEQARSYMNKQGVIDQNLARIREENARNEPSAFDEIRRWPK